MAGRVDGAADDGGARFRAVAGFVAERRGHTAAVDQNDDKTPFTAPYLLFLSEWDEL